MGGLPTKGRKKALSYESKRKRRQNEARKRHALQKTIRVFPTSSWGFYNQGIHACDTIGQRFDIKPSKLWSVAAEIYGRSARSLAILADRINTRLENDSTYDAFVATREETIQKKVIEAVLDSYLDDEGRVTKNPTFLEYYKDVANACKDIDINPMAKSTMWKYTKVFHWSFKTPNKQTNLNKVDTMAKRVQFSKELLAIFDNPMMEALFMDEMSFFVYKNRCKRLAPMDNDKVFFECITPSRHPSLNISTYMTPNHLLSMHFKKETTTAEHFGEEFLDALRIADQKVDPKKTINVILDNARWHKKELLEKIIDIVKKECRERETRQDMGHIDRTIIFTFTSPNSPDLNLVEFFNHYYKAALRRALDVFRYITIERPDRRGRKATKPKKPSNKPAKPRKMITAFSFSNLAALGKYVYQRIMASQHAVGNWYNAQNHVRKWANAFIKDGGSVVKVTSTVAKDTSAAVKYVISEGSTIDQLTVTRVSTRLNGIECLPVQPPFYIAFDEKEVNNVAVEGYPGWVENEQEQVEIDEQLIMSDDDYDNDDGDDEEAHPIAEAPVKRKAQDQGKRVAKKQRRLGLDDDSE